MKDYVIYTDSACDIKPEQLEAWGVRYAELTFRFTDSEKEYKNSEMDINEFYDKMRAGFVAKTAAINSETFVQAFETELKDDKDILYLGFSSGLSTTFNSARIAAAQLAESYPDSKVLVVDTLAASAGEGLLLYLAVEKKNSGASIEEVAEYIESIKLRLCHWFTVDDLVYLKRGGRIGAASYFVGSMLGIKPVLHVDNEGHLVSVQKVRGRKTAVSTIASKYGELSDKEISDKVYISHADCMNDVEELKSILASKYGASVEIVTDVGTVIGAHSGPGTLALFFVGKER